MIIPQKGPSICTPYQSLQPFFWNYLKKSNFFLENVFFPLFTNNNEENFLRSRFNEKNYQTQSLNPLVNLEQVPATAYVCLIFLGFHVYEVNIYSSLFCYLTLGHVH